MGAFEGADEDVGAAVGAADEGAALGADVGARVRLTVFVLTLVAPLLAHCAQHAHSAVHGQTSKKYSEGASPVVMTYEVRSEDFTRFIGVNWSLVPAARFQSCTTKLVTESWSSSVCARTEERVMCQMCLQRGSCGDEDRLTRAAGTQLT